MATTNNGGTMKVEINFDITREGIDRVVCLVEIPEKDPDTGNDFLIFREEKHIASVHVDSWEIYQKKLKTATELLAELYKNIERFALHGKKELTDGND